MRPRPSTPNDELLNHLKSLEGTLRDIKVQVRHQTPMSPMKKIAIGLGLAFLSASTVRYWFDKIEPVAKAYAEAHTQHDDPPVYVLEKSGSDSAGSNFAGLHSAESNTTELNSVVPNSIKSTSSWPDSRQYRSELQYRVSTYGK